MNWNICANNIDVNKCEQIINNLSIGLEKLIINYYTKEKIGLLKKHRLDAQGITKRKKFYAIKLECKLSISSKP